MKSFLEKNRKTNKLPHEFYVGSFNHSDINSARSSKTELSATELVRSRFLSGSRKQSLVSLWKPYII